MKNLLLLFLCGLTAVPVTGQKIEVFPNQVQGLNQTFRLDGAFGKSTATKTLWVSNHTQQILQVFARPHVEGDALYLMNKEGTTSREFTLKVLPGATGALYLFGFLDQGAARSCDGYLALALTPLNPDGSKGVTRTVKLPATVNFQSDRSTPAVKQLPAANAKTQQPERKNANATTKTDKPDQYEYIEYEGLPMHWHLRQLPIRIYSEHENTGDTATKYASVVRRALDIWNTVGRNGNGVKQDFFKIVSSRSQADIRIEWNGKHLLSGAQGTAYPTDGMISMMPMGRFISPARAAESLLQELGHMLGLGHSEQSNDIMFHRARNYCPDLAQMNVTGRDAQMLIWLYNQRQYVAFKD